MSYQDTGKSLIKPDPPIEFPYDPVKIVELSPEDYKSVVFGPPRDRFNFELPEERNEEKSMDAVSKAGQVFEDVYVSALSHMNALDAADLAQDAVMNYLENVGIVRSVDASESQDLAVRVTNVEEIAEACLSKMLGSPLKQELAGEIKSWPKTKALIEEIEE